MKKILFALLLIPFIFIAMGSSCEDEPTEDLMPPSNVQLKGATDELALSITWTGSPDAEVTGYKIYFNNVEIADLAATARNYEHSVGGAAPTLGAYEIIAYDDNRESDPLEFDTRDYVKDGTFTVYDMSAPVGFNSGVGFNASGVASTYSMSDDGNGNVVDFYYDNDGTFTSANYLGGAWVNTSGFASTTNTWDNLKVVDLSGYNVATSGIALNQIWQVVLFKNTPTTWNYAKFKIESTATTPQVTATVSYKIQTIQNWARVSN